MNFKGGGFSAGGGKISDSVFKDGRIYFLQSGGSAFRLRSFDAKAKKFAEIEKNISYADKCFFCGERLLQLFGMMLSDADALLFGGL